jgi:hypothetical protein
MIRALTGKSIRDVVVSGDASICSSSEESPSANHRRRLRCRSCDGEACRLPVVPAGAPPTRRTNRQGTSSAASRRFQRCEARNDTEGRRNAPRVNDTKAPTALAAGAHSECVQSVWGAIHHLAGLFGGAGNRADPSPRSRALAARTFDASTSAAGASIAAEAPCAFPAPCSSGVPQPRVSRTPGCDTCDSRRAPWRVLR